MSFSSPTAVSQILTAADQLFRRLTQVAEGILQVIYTVHLVQVQLLQGAVFRHRHGGQQGEVLHIRRDGHVLRDVQINGLAIPVFQSLQPQALAEAGHGDTHHNGAVAAVDHFAVGYLHVAGRTVVQQQAGDHQEGLIECDLFPVDLPGFGGVVLVVKLDAQLAGGPVQLFRRHRFPFSRYETVTSTGSWAVLAPW